MLTTPYVDFMNWSLGVNVKGQPINNPAKDASVDGVLVAPGSATNWPPPTFSPKTGLLYVGTTQVYGIQYLTDTDERPEGYGGGAVGAASGSGGREPGWTLQNRPLVDRSKPATTGEATENE